MGQRSWTMRVRVPPRVATSQHSPHDSPATPPYEPPFQGSLMAVVMPARTKSGKMESVRSNSHQPPLLAS